MKKAIITGLYGQDGSYLFERLSELNYDIFGIVKEPLSLNSYNNKNIISKNNNPKVYSINLYDCDALKKFIYDIKPDEIYHLAASHFSSQDNLESKNYLDKQLFDNNVKATSNILYSCLEIAPKARIVLAGSCLMFDNTKSNIQNELTPFESNSLYGLSKIAEYYLANYYRNNGLHVSMAILYNHESSRRSINFVTKKIISNMIAIKNRQIINFSLGNINSKKDWGYAKDYVNGMYLMAQQEFPDDYILSSGKLNSIKDIIDICADYLGISDWEKFITIEPGIITRSISSQLLGDPNKANQKLGWNNSVSFKELIELMIKDELDKD